MDPLDPAFQDAIRAVPDRQHHLIWHSLLHSTAMGAGMKRDQVEVNFAANHADGGIDARTLRCGGDASGFIPDGDAIYQLKTHITITSGILDEMMPKDSDDGERTLRPAIQELWEGGGTYVLVEWGERPKDMVQKALDEMAKIAADHGFSRDQVRYYALDKIRGQIAWFPAVYHLILGIGLGIDYDNWANGNEFQDTRWHPDPAREATVSSLQETWGKNVQSCVRIVGPSGIGKTRLALEALKPVEHSRRVAYFSDPSGVVGTTEFNKLLRRSDLNAILVVDNCPPNTQVSLWEALDRVNLKIHLVAIGGAAKASATPQVQLGALAEAELCAAIRDINADLSSEAMVAIAKWTEGFPALAVLFARYSVGLREDQLAEFLDSGVASRVGAIVTVAAETATKAGEDPASIEQFLELLAVLGAVNLQDDEAILGWLATRCGLEAHRVHVVLDQMKDAGLIEGDYVRRVKPIAVRVVLIRRWFQANATGGPALQAFLASVEDESPDAYGRFVHGLTNGIDAITQSFAGMTLAGDLLEKSGWFADLKAIADSVTQGFLEALVRCAPDQGVRAIARIIDQAPDAQLLEARDSRRTLVHSLQGLVFWREHFPEAIRLLRRLSLLENESWANNATGVYVDQFKVAPGKVATTQAPPVERLPELDDLFHVDTEEARSLLENVLDSALRCDYFVRDSGPEFQGLREPLSGWTPDDYEAARFEYLDAILDRVEALAATGAQAGIAARVLAKNARVILQQVPALGNQVLDLLKAISTEHHEHRLEVLEAIVDVVHYDRERVASDVMEPWATAEAEMTQGSLARRLDRFVLLSPIHDEVTDSDVNLQTVLAELADDLVSGADSRLVQEFLSAGRMENSSRGRRLGAAIGQHADGVRLMSLIEEGMTSDPASMSGFLFGLLEREPQFVDEWACNQIAENPLGPISGVLRSGPFTPKIAEAILLHLAGHDDLAGWEWFAGGIGLGRFSRDEQRDFVANLLSSGAEWAWHAAVHSVYSSMGIGKRASLASLGEELVRQLLLDCPDEAIMAEESQADSAWGGVAKVGIRDWPELAPLVFERFLAAAGSAGRFRRLDHWIKEAVRDAFAAKADECWKLLVRYFDALEGHGLFLHPLLTFLFDDEDGVLESIPPGRLIDLIESEPAKYGFPITAALPQDLSDGAHLMIVAEKLGNHTEVIEGARAAFGSSSWWGSEARHLEGRRDAFKAAMLHAEKPWTQEWLASEIASVEARMPYAAARDEALPAEKMTFYRYQA